MSSARMRPRACVSGTISVPSGCARSRMVCAASTTETIGYAETRGTATSDGLAGAESGDQALEELVHEHLGHARQHALPDSCQHAAYLPLAVPLTKPGPPLPSTCNV